jgi:hypothetical protein
MHPCSQQEDVMITYLRKCCSQLNAYHKPGLHYGWGRAFYVIHTGAESGYLIEEIRGQCRVRELFLNAQDAWQEREVTDRTAMKVHVRKDLHSYFPTVHPCI